MPSPAATATATPPSTGRIVLSLLPSVVGVALQFAVVLSLPRCAPSSAAWTHAASFVALLLALWSIQRSWAALQQADRAWRGGAGSSGAQARFLGLGITVLAVTLAAVIVMHWVAAASIRCDATSALNTAHPANSATTASAVAARGPTSH